MMIQRANGVSIGQQAEESRHNGFRLRRYRAKVKVAAAHLVRLKLKNHRLLRLSGKVRFVPVCRPDLATLDRQDFGGVILLHPNRLTFSASTRLFVSVGTRGQWSGTGSGIKEVCHTPPTTSCPDLTPTTLPWNGY